MIGKSGKIITFYSYKGGAGRTMAVSNVAWVLASNGYDVLLIDWDLEAPGLHRYLRPFLVDRELTSSPGVIDFVWDAARVSITPARSCSMRSAGQRDRLARVRFLVLPALR
jgi:MinD-like ATPase involved in chromosome partitioning or flagellar assembly